VHQPGRGGVAQGVRGDLARQTGELHSRFEPSLHRYDRLAVELNKAGGDQFAVLPATQVSKQPRRYGHGRLALLGGPLADRLAIEDAALEIDVRPAGLRIGRR
jgi:hypothetical protein